MCKKQVFNADPRGRARWGCVYGGFEHRRVISCVAGLLKMQRLLLGVAWPAWALLGRPASQPHSKLPARQLASAASARPQPPQLTASSLSLSLQRRPRYSEPLLLALLGRWWCIGQDRWRAAAPATGRSLTCGASGHLSLPPRGSAPHPSCRSLQARIKACKSRHANQHVGKSCAASVVASSRTRPASLTSQCAAAVRQGTHNQAGCCLGQGGRQARTGTSHPLHHDVLNCCPTQAQTYTSAHPGPLHCTCCS